MKLENLASSPGGTLFDADLVIVGGGPVGLTIAREFAHTPFRVLVLESGLLNEDEQYSSLNELELVGRTHSDAEAERRVKFRGADCATWSDRQQPYGFRCRALGGTTHAWAGRSAPLDPIDFAYRPWIPHSGWPIDYDAQLPFVHRALEVLNLGRTPPDRQFDIDGVCSYFWQFARSRLDWLDVMRFGREFVQLDAPNVRVLLNATATHVKLAPDGLSFSELEISTLDGVRSAVRARAAVIAAGGIENPRLLLASNSVHQNGVGNSNDLVGRYLMDHPGATVGTFSGGSIAPIAKWFGYVHVRDRRRTLRFMHGLTLDPVLQEREGLSNCAICFIGERSPDDPWDALKRLLRRSSITPIRDVRYLLSGGRLLAEGIGMELLMSGATPKVFKKLTLKTAAKRNHNSIGEPPWKGNVPHKLTSVSMEAATEQRPNFNNRVMLSGRCDRLGIPLAKVDWRIDDEDRRSLLRIAQLAAAALPSAGLPPPKLDPWVIADRPSDGVVTDVAHTLGTTRMSENPKSGVVDKDCQVHGVRGLYVAGGSIFPTGGHANPTLMMVALAIRLSDTLKEQLSVL